MTHHTKYDDGIPDDLRAVARALDRLASADRATLSAEAADRLAAALRLSAVHASLDAEGRAARTHAPAGLEPRVFEHSRPALGTPSEPPAMLARLPSVTTHRRVRVMAWAGRVAAAFVLLAGGALAWVALRPAPIPSGAGAPTAAVGEAPPAASDLVFAMLASLDAGVNAREIDSLLMEADSLFDTLSATPPAALPAEILTVQ